MRNSTWSEELQKKLSWHWWSDIWSLKCLILLWKFTEKIEFKNTGNFVFQDEWEPWLGVSDPIPLGKEHLLDVTKTSEQPKVSIQHLNDVFLSRMFFGIGQVKSIYTSPDLNLTGPRILEILNSCSTHMSGLTSYQDFY